jgi:hypothetical protein
VGKQYQTRDATASPPELTIPDKVSGSRRAASPSPLGPCAGGSSRPRSPSKRSSATDAERVILPDAYQAPLRYGPLPHPYPLVIHRFRDPGAGDAYALVLPTSWSATRFSAVTHRSAGSRHHLAPLRVGSGAWTSAQRDGSRSTHSGVLRRRDHQQRCRTVGRPGLSVRLDRGRRGPVTATAPSSRTGKEPA